MTLILSVAGDRSIWLLADRRLSRNGRPLQDDACKMLFVEAEDGAAIFGYAGLGKTAAGTEPSEWMSAVLRGRNHKLEGYLEVLRQALQRELPRHTSRLPNFAHNVVAIAYLNREARVYTVDMQRCPTTGSVEFRATRHIQKHNKPPMFGLAGSGALLLAADKSWMRSLARLVKAHDRGQIDHMPVASYLAKLNAKVSRQMADGSVGHACLVACRHRDGGGGYWCYEDGAFGGNAAPPNILRGTDMKAFGRVLLEDSIKLFARMEAGEVDPRPDEKALNDKIAQLPRMPDEKLR
jgi:hypothetical protein